MSKRVLILEDESNTREILVRAVSHERGLTLLAAVGTLDEARIQLQMNCYPDLLLVDLGLPDGNGIDLIRAVRQGNPVLPRTPGYISW